MHIQWAVLQAHHHQHDPNDETDYREEVKVDSFTQASDASIMDYPNRAIIAQKFILIFKVKHMFSINEFQLLVYCNVKF